MSPFLGNGAVQKAACSTLENNTWCLAECHCVLHHGHDGALLVRHCRGIGDDISHHSSGALPEIRDTFTLFTLNHTIWIYLNLKNRDLRNLCGLLITRSLYHLCKLRVNDALGKGCGRTPATFWIWTDQYTTSLNFSMTCNETLAPFKGGPSGTVKKCRLFLDACRDSRQVAVPVAEWPSTDLKDFRIDTTLTLDQAQTLTIHGTFVTSAWAHVEHSLPGVGTVARSGWACGIMAFASFGAHRTIGFSWGLCSPVHRCGECGGTALEIPEGPRKYNLQRIWWFDDKEF